MPYTYPTFDGAASATYFATPEIAEIVNLAIRLGRPLLVEGEAGCGKTRLAGAIAEVLGLQANFVTATVKSTSQAKDLLYRFDALRRLQDAQDRDNPDARFVHPYIDLEPLGQAIADGRPGVVLVDEIDKADIDFPNDLLDVLDRFEFDIEDLPLKEDAACLAARGFGRHVRAPDGGVRPIVVITSNREKQLPEPFLRRCLYVQLGFPDDEGDLAVIVGKNLGAGPDAIGAEIVDAAVQRFMAVRRRALELNVQKPPATSELLDWVRVLHWRATADGAMPVAGVPSGVLTPSDHAVLFKLRQDVKRFQDDAARSAPAVADGAAARDATA